MIHRYCLPPTLTYPDEGKRHYVLIPAWSHWGEAYLTISQGEVGPRGGKSKLDVESYYVQRDVDPDADFIGTVYMLAKDSDTDADIYETMIPHDRGVPPVCTCDGYRSAKHCKHGDALEHITRVIGWSSLHATPQLASSTVA